MKTSALNLDTVRGTVQVAYDGVQHQPNLLVLTDEEIANLSDVSFEVGDVIDASSIQKAFLANCCCVYLKNWLRLGGDDVIIGGVTFKADGTQEGLVINYESIDWPGSKEEIILGDGSRMTLEDLAEDPSFSNTYIGLTGNANDVMLGNNTAITIANLENRIVSDKNLVNKSVTDTLASDIEDLLETTQDIYSRITGLGNQLTTIDGKVASNTQKISNNTNLINALKNTVNGLSETVSEMNNTIAGLDNIYVSKTGDTMSGELVVANSNYRTRVSGGGILVWDKNTSATAATLISPHSITSKLFILVNGNSDQILLGDGTTTSLSQITSRFGSYLPLTGGTLSGDLNTPTKIKVGRNTSEQDGTTIRPNYIDLYDSNNEELVSISCDDGTFVVYDSGADNYAKVACGGILVQVNASPATATSITPNSVTSGSFILNTGTSDLILLANGTTTSLSQITNRFGNYLPLAGGTLTGDLNLSRTSKIRVGDATGDSSTIIRPNDIHLWDESNEKEVRISCWQGYLSVYDGPSSQYCAPVFCSGTRIYDNDNKNTVTISCGDGSFVVYSDNLNDYGTVVCGGVQIPNATDGKLVMATGLTNSLYGLCGGHIHSTTGQEATLYKKVYSTGFLNIYNIFGQDAINNTVTSGRLNAEQSEVIREMYICNIMPTNIYYRFGDDSVATKTSLYIPVGCRRGFAMDTYIFYFMQPTVLGMQIIRITVSIPDATSTLSWTKEVSNITISA